MDAGSLYALLVHLVKTWPDLSQTTPEVQQWLARVTIAVEATGDFVDVAMMKVQVPILLTGTFRSDGAAREISAVIYRALARAERDAPVALRDAFIPAGNAFDALAMIGKILQSATAQILIVDPYMDANTLTDYAVLAPEQVTIRLVADARRRKDPLIPAVEKWKQQYAGRRPLDARLAPHGALHDRLLILDSREAWTLTQSLNQFAVRSPAALERTEADAAALKIAFYEEAFKHATSI